MISATLNSSKPAPTTMISLARVGFPGLALANLMNPGTLLPAGDLVLPTGHGTTAVNLEKFPKPAAAQTALVTQ